MSSKGIGRRQRKQNNDLDLDEIDEFAKQRHKVNFSSSSSSDLDSDDAQILGIDDDQSSSSDQSIESSFSEEDVGLIEQLDGQHLADVGKFEGHIPDEHFDSSVWGSKKHAYYGADIRDVNERNFKYAKQEEEEAIRLQKEAASKLKQSHFLSDDDDDDASDGLHSSSDSDNTETLGDRVTIFPGAKPTTPSSSSDSSSSDADSDSSSDASDSLDVDQQMENVPVNFSQLPREQRLALIERQAPEMFSLFSEFQEKIETVQDTVAPVLEKCRAQRLPTAEGMSFLEAKFHLLLSYCINIVFYALLKSSGDSVKGHPVIDQLIRIRLILDKLKPLDAKLKYQIDKLIKMAKIAQSQGEEAATSAQQAYDKQDPLQYAPNLGNIEGATSSTTTTTNAEQHVYRVPKISAMEFEEQRAREEKKRKKLAKKASRSSMLRFLKEKYGNAPIQESVHPVQSMSAASKQDQLDREEEEHRLRYEEENFLRLPTTRKDKKRQKRRERAQFQQELDNMEDFGDITSLLRSSASSKPLGHYINEIQQGHMPKDMHRSGDADLPRKEFHQSTKSTKSSKRGKKRGRGKKSFKRKRR